MTLAAALIGWTAAAIALAIALRLGARLELAGRAEHELRGALTGVHLLAECERGGSARALAFHVARADAGLEDLGRACGAQPTARGAQHLLLRGLVADVVAACRPAARRLGRAIELDWTAGPVAVRGDRGRMAQALGNLVSNALEHGEGVVRLLARRAPGGVRLEVRDEGSGIDRRPARGRGRGLVIAERAVAEAGGRLSLAAAPSSAVAIELPVEDA